MVLAFYQNGHREEDPKPDLYQFFEFYANFDESKTGLIIDLSPMFPEEYKKLDATTFDLQEHFDAKEPKRRFYHCFSESKIDMTDGLYIKDPIGYNYYKIADELFAFRENIGVSAFRYTEVVKPHFIEASKELSFHEGVDWLFRIFDKNNSLNSETEKEGNQILMKKVKKR